MTKKVTAIVLALILGLSSMITVVAEEVSEGAQTEAITESTAEVTAKAGENAVFSVKTIGEVRSYQWQVSKNGGKKWTDLNPKTYGATETLTIPVKADYDGYLYRCEVTFMDYRVDHSAAAKLTVATGSISASTMTASGKTCVITVDFGEAAKIPEDAELEVTEISTEDAAWMARSLRFADAVYDQYGHVTISDLRFLSLRILANGEEIEPEAAVQIKVEYRDTLNTEDVVEYEATTEKPSHFIAVHYGKDGAQVLEAENRAVDGGISETTLWTEGLSDFDLAYVYEYKASEKATFEITYDPTGDSVMPHGNLSPEDVLKIIGNGGKNQVNASGEPLRGVGDKPEIEKTLTDNGDGTYTLGLSVTGDADTESTTAANANVVIIYDVSTSMTYNYIPMTNGGRGLDTSSANNYQDGDYFQLYSRGSNGRYQQITNDTYTGTVYRREGNNYTEYTGQRYSYRVWRADAAEKVLYDFTTSLFSYQNADDPTNIQAALVVFADTNNAQVLQGWTTTANDITRRVSSSGTSHSLTYYNYTNWEAALSEAYTELLTTGRRDDDPTYVVFITDGAPTRSGGGTGTNVTSPYTNSEQHFQYYVPALNEARLIEQSCEETGGAFFGIFAFGKETDWLASLMYYAYNGTVAPQAQAGTTFTTDGYYNASSAEDLQSAVSDIFQKIVNTLGVGSATISDGTTSAVQTSQGIADLLVVNENSYQYWLSWMVTAGSGGTYTFVWNDLATADPVTYTVTPSGENVVITWTTPGGENKTATYKGSVSMNKLTIEWLPENGKTDFYNYNAPAAQYSSSKSAVDWNLTSVGTLLDSVTYTVTFEVYPSQTALDLIADLENGYIDYDTELDPAIKQYLTKSGDTYVLETNTTATLSYEDTRTDDGPQEETFDNPPPEPVTATEMMAVSKKWSNTLDNRYNWQSQSIDLLVTRDDTPRYDITLNNDNDWEGTVAISIGIMTVDANGNVDLKTTGHDYSFAEEVEISHQWYLKADTVRPMKINNVDTILVKVDASEAASLFADTDANKRAVSGDNTYYKLTIDGEEMYYKVDEAGASATLSATNHRRSYLDVVKVVDAENAPGEFTFKMTVDTKAEGADPANTDSDYWVWFSIWDPVSNSILKDQNAVSGEGLRYEMENGSFNGYFYIPSGNEITVMMKNGYSLRFLNLPVGATYTVAETDMPAGYGYNFKSIEGERGFDADGQPTYKTNDQGEVILDGDGNPTLIYNDWTTEEAGTVSGQSITGTIEYPESAYKVTVTNELKYFYVYHSSNKTVEQIAMDDARVTADGKFNIVNEVNTGRLYGGYFSAYKYAGKTTEEIIGLTYEENGTESGGVYAAAKTTGKWATDSAGTAYTGQASAWSKGYTDSGLALPVAAGAVYYLKEIPDDYFRPALYYVYDERAEGLPILKLYLILPTDDGYYQNVGGTCTGFDLAISKRLYSTFKVTSADGSTEAITVKTANSNLTRGYLAVWELNDLLVQDKTYTWTPFFVTKDNVKVTSARTRTISVGDKGHGKGDGSDGHFGATDTEATSTATAAN